MSHCSQGLLSRKQFTQLDAAAAFCGCFQRDQERQTNQPTNQTHATPQEFLYMLLYRKTRKGII